MSEVQTPDLVNTPLLNAALSKAQGAMQNAEKDRANPAFKSSYATLASTFDAVRKPLADNGLSVFQNPETILEGSKIVLVKCVSEIRHSSGERLVTSPIVIPVASPHGAWQIGSAISYAKRYQVQSMLGIAAAEDDDDATAAQGDGSKQNQNNGPAQGTKQQQRTTTPAQGSRPNPVKQAEDFAKKNGGVIAPKIEETDLAFDRATLVDPSGYVQDHENQQRVDKSVEFVDTPPPEAPPVTLLDQLVQCAADFAIPNERMSQIIKQVTGTNLRSQQLDTNQLTKVINWIKLTQPKKS
jgi:hypothetical protein